MSAVGKSTSERGWEKEGAPSPWRKIRNDNCGEAWPRKDFWERACKEQLTCGGDGDDPRINGGTPDLLS